MAAELLEQAAHDTDLETDKQNNSLSSQEKKKQYYQEQ